MTPWWAEYIGIPFKDGGRDALGCDCWGLVRLVYAEQLGIDLPLVDGYTHVKDGPGIQAMLDQWLPQWALTDEPGEWDVPLFRMAGIAHVGVMIDSTRMLHVMHGRDACIERVERVGRPTIYSYLKSA